MPPHLTSLISPYPYHCPTPEGEMVDRGWGDWELQGATLWSQLGDLGEMLARGPAGQDVELFSVYVFWGHTWGSGLLWFCSFHSWWSSGEPKSAACTANTLSPCTISPLFFPGWEVLQAPNSLAELLKVWDQVSRPTPKVMLSPASFTSLNSTMIVHKCFIVIRPLRAGHGRPKIVLETIHSSSRTFKKCHLGCVCVLGYVYVGICMCWCVCVCVCVACVCVCLK